MSLRSEISDLGIVVVSADTLKIQQALERIESTAKKLFGRYTLIKGESSSVRVFFPQNCIHGHDVSDMLGAEAVTSVLWHAIDSHAIRFPESGRGDLGFEVARAKCYGETVAVVRAVHVVTDQIF